MLIGVSFVQPSCSYFFQQIWLLPLHSLKFPFHCQEGRGFSISRSFFSSIFPWPCHWCSAQHRFLSWHPRWRVPENHVGSWATASHSLPVGATSRQRHVHHLDGKRGYAHHVRANPELLLNTASAECVRALSDTLISENCFQHPVILPAWWLTDVIKLGLAGGVFLAAGNCQKSRCLISSFKKLFVLLCLDTFFFFLNPPSLPSWLCSLQFISFFFP